MHIIGGKYKGRVLVAPKTEYVRPTTSQLRESLFNICQTYIEDASFLDLFAGSGAMGLEALSRGCAHATFIENNRFALGALKKNIAQLQVETQCTLLPLSFLKGLTQLAEKNETFDVIYVDPPYGKGFAPQVLQFLDAYPLLKKEGSLFIEELALAPISLQKLERVGQRRAGNTHLYEYRYLTEKQI